MTTEMKTVEKIRDYYVEKDTSKINQLKALDKRVKRPAQIFAYVFGSVASLILGAGMCFAMKVIGTTLPFAMPLGIAIGLLGILLVSINYPLYKGILKARKNKYSKQILELSDDILNK